MTRSNRRLYWIAPLSGLSCVRWGCVRTGFADGRRIGSLESGCEPTGRPHNRRTIGGLEPYASPRDHRVRGSRRPERLRGAWRRSPVANPDDARAPEHVEVTPAAALDPTRAGTGGEFKRDE